MYGRNKNKRKKEARTKLILFTLLISISFYLGGLFIKKGYYGDIKTKASDLTNSVSNIVKNIGITIDDLEINMSDSAYQKLENQVGQSLEEGVFRRSNQDYVTGNVNFNDSTYKVNIRLKGALRDHWETDKWSLKLKLTDNESFKGLKKFTIQHPQTRGFYREWVGLQAVKKENIIAIRSWPINVKINGKEKGLYIMEEHFDKRLIEHYGYKDGPILRFDGRAKRQNIEQRTRFGIENRELGSFYTSPIDGYGEKKLPVQYQKAASLLESFRNGDLLTSDVFDVKKLSSYIALKELFGSFEIDHNDLRFYYNPVTSRLEPIGFDFHVSDKPINSLFCSYTFGIEKFNDNHLKKAPNFLGRVFDDPKFFKLYIKSLQKISQKEYLDSLFAEIDEELGDWHHGLKREFSRLKPLNKTVYYQNQAFIRSVLSPKKMLIANLVSCDSNTIEVEIGNIQAFPIDVIKLTYKDSLTLFEEGDTLIPGKKLAHNIPYKNLIFKDQAGEHFKTKITKSLRVYFKILGTDKVYSEKVSKFLSIDNEMLADDATRMIPNVEKFRFLVVDEDSKRIKFKQGAWRINQNLIIPSGYKLVAPQGLRLNLGKGAKIISYSPLEFIGSTQNPVRIYSLDHTGQGIIVYFAEKQSILENVVFELLSNPMQKGWELPGSVTFYESPVRIKFCTFKNNIQGDDYLNIIRAKFDISSCKFMDVKADAFDSDFSSGEIRNTIFMDCGNDGIDLSGSNVKITEIKMRGIKDKGISIGEKSNVKLNDIRIRHTEMAITAKDLSDVVAEKITLDSCRVGFVVFKKKAEYGGAKIRATSVTQEKVETSYLLERGSKLNINYKTKIPNYNNVKPILYGNKYGVKSK